LASYEYTLLTDGRNADDLDAALKQAGATDAQLAKAKQATADFRARTEEIRRTPAPDPKTNSQEQFLAARRAFDAALIDATKVARDRVRGVLTPEQLPRFEWALREQVIRKGRDGAAALRVLAISMMPKLTTAPANGSYSLVTTSAGGAETTVTTVTLKLGEALGFKRDGEKVTAVPGGREVPANGPAHAWRINLDAEGK
jgi:hypothetical protein